MSERESVQKGASSIGGFRAPLVVSVLLETMKPTTASTFHLRTQLLNLVVWFSWSLSELKTTMLFLVTWMNTLKMTVGNCAQESVMVFVTEAWMLVCTIDAVEAIPFSPRVGTYGPIAGTNLHPPNCGISSSEVFQCLSGKYRKGGSNRDLSGPPVDAGWVRLEWVRRQRTPAKQQILEQVPVAEELVQLVEVFLTVICLKEEQVEEEEFSLE
ncbi:hypothetical protein K435DRAFT_798247 [Dendrothele bispora CBS 962.96]|uniref:Uncharacterized protein n=1 Tax=Dendrothele bispora (strain CBS 962.96) TaxID=1314807 RepID=A0A4S8M0A9_DENBC|nr:hypothetical protein K435DRAFT_798247 [Dendrothele bispora CBS 962.96]